ncbi:MAG TPA: GspH/FimT family pseudopilin, partial [Thauera aminoaromatica]|nr:GspH/FimT family pseudopilin [Thauera aminoaromatica]
MRTPIQRGFGLVEAMVTIAVLAILLAVAVPSFQQMIVNGRTRTIAESFRAGVDLARTEAMRRNLPVGFAVVSAVTGCSADTTGTNWVVFLGTTCNNDATVVQRFVAGGSEAGVTVSAS